MPRRPFLTRHPGQQPQSLVVITAAVVLVAVVAAVPVAVRPIAVAVAIVPVVPVASFALNADLKLGDPLMEAAGLALVEGRQPDGQWPWSVGLVRA